MNLEYICSVYYIQWPQSQTVYISVLCAIASYRKTDITMRCKVSVIERLENMLWVDSTQHTHFAIRFVVSNRCRNKGKQRKWEDENMVCQLLYFTLSKHEITLSMNDQLVSLSLNLSPSILSSIFVLYSPCLSLYLCRIVSSSSLNISIYSMSS